MTSVNPNTELLLITGASGKQGTAILKNLAPKWKHLRLQCNSQSSASRLQTQYPNAEIIQSDFKTIESATKLLSGVSAAYLLTPGMHPDELGSGMAFLAAAKNMKLGLKHLVFASVIHPQLTSLVNHLNKLKIEEALIESGIPFTILQPTHFMDNIPIKMLAETGKFNAIFNPDVKISFCALHDLGECVSKVFLEREKYLYGIFELVSNKLPLSYNEVMEIAGQVLGKEILVERMSVEEGVGFFEKVAMPKDMDEAGKSVMRNGFEAMIRHYEGENAGGLVGNGVLMDVILGRKGLEVREWMEMQLGMAEK